MSESTKLSHLAEKLPHEAKLRYFEKLKLCNLPSCPYIIPDYLFKRGLSQVEPLVPDMTEFHIMIYLIFNRSKLTEEELLAWKSLEAREYLKNGWVGDVAFLQLQDGNVIVKGKVCHSQSPSLDPLVPWTVAKPNGFVVAAHCNCKAG